jgi:ribonuclease PH
MKRHDGRADDAVRPMEIVPGFLNNPPGSALVSMGRTRVLCAASVDESVPAFLRDQGEGWVTGEYAMLPASTNTRTQREIVRGRPSGRTMEIQRLIGRALRSVVDRKALGERTVWVDCDVLEADGGTRTAAVNGGFVALALALATIQDDGKIKGPVLTAMLGAISVGIVEGRPALDLDYIEDSAADVDMNVVRTDCGRYVEVQGTAESTPFKRERLDQMLALADQGIDHVVGVQRQVLGAKLDSLLIPR